jgi:hypothetical protein
VIEFDTHNQRREFVNRLVGITPSERLLYLKKGQFDEIGITSFLVDRPNCLGGSGTLENISEDEEKPEEDTPDS